MMYKENLQIDWMVSTIYSIYIHSYLFYKSDSVKDSKGIFFLIYIIDTNGNSSYIRLF